MKLGTRLLLPLLAAVSVVMLAYALGSLRQREAFMLGEAERETRAYATALGLALERAIGEAPAAPQEMIDRIDRDPSIYGVIVYDPQGAALYVSSPLVQAPPAAAEEVREIASAAAVSTQRREILGEESVVVFRPLLDEAGRVLGILEVVQPLGSVTAQLERTRLRFLLNTLTLVVAVTLLLSWLVRRHLSAPIGRFVEAVRALGGGELSHRVDPHMAGGELAEVAEELNRMADRLQEARRDLLREAEERVSLERRLLQSEKLAEVGRLAAGLAHEIGAPLHVIRGRADLVLKGPADAVGRERNLAIIVQQIDRIAVIVRNLLGYARRREPRMISVDLVGVVRSVHDLLEAEAARIGVRLVVEGRPQTAAVRGDPDLLYQVVLNAALNALHALEEADHAGTVVLRVAQRAADAVIVEVEDDGPGIPPELRDRVFEPFYTTKAAGRGTGLGLALARAIVSDHGGSIAALAATRPDLSTRIRIELPCEGPPALAPVAVPRRAETAAHA